MASERFEMRVPQELLARLDGVRGYESRASFVKRALEKALVTDPVAAEDGRVSKARVPASSRMPARSVALERQARLNKAREKG